MTRSYTIPRNFRRVVRRILGHGTYSLCQLSYDVGQRASIASQNCAWNGPRIFILYAKWKTALRSHKPGPVNPPIPREKLYANRSYLRACPRRQADGAVARRRRDHAAPRPDGTALDYGRGEWRERGGGIGSSPGRWPAQTARPGNSPTGGIGSGSSRPPRWRT